MSIHFLKFVCFFSFSHFHFFLLENTKKGSWGLYLLFRNICNYQISYKYSFSFWSFENPCFHLEISFKVTCLVLFLNFNQCYRVSPSCIIKTWGKVCYCCFWPSPKISVPDSDIMTAKQILSDEQCVLLHGPTQKHTQLADPWNLLSRRFVAVGESVLGKSFLAASVLWVWTWVTAQVHWGDSMQLKVRETQNCEGKHQQGRCSYKNNNFYCNFLFLFQVVWINSEERRPHWTPKLSSVAFPTL